MVKTIKIIAPPKEITPANLECIVMPNGEILSNGVSLGFMTKFQGCLTVRGQSDK